MKLKKILIDEIELYLELLKSDYPEEINRSTYKEIAQLIQSNFGVECSEQDIFLLHEPTIEEESQDLEYYYTNVLGIH